MLTLPYFFQKVRAKIIHRIVVHLQKTILPNHPRLQQQPDIASVVREHPDIALAIREYLSSSTAIRQIGFAQRFLLAIAILQIRLHSTLPSPTTSLPHHLL